MDASRRYITVLPHEVFDARMHELGLSSDNVGNETDKAFISITSTLDCQRKYLEELEGHWFDGKTDNVLNLSFDDIPKEEFEFKGCTFKGITDEQSMQVAQFIDKHKGKDFYVHCRAGMSRSVAVGVAICDLLGEEYGYGRRESFIYGNKPDTPNVFVLASIKRAWMKLQGININ